MLVNIIVHQLLSDLVRPKVITFTGAYCSRVCFFSAIVIEIFMFFSPLKIGTANGCPNFAGNGFATLGTSPAPLCFA
jgi:hypothetical protein